MAICWTQQQQTAWASLLSRFALAVLCWVETSEGVYNVSKGCMACTGVHAATLCCALALCVSYPMSAKQIIPNSQAVAFNWICLVVAVLLVELGVFWRRHSLTVALAGIVHEIWSCVGRYS